MAVTVEQLLDRIASELIESSVVDKQVLNNNQLTIKNGQLKIGRNTSDNLILYQKDERANESDLLAEINISEDNDVQNFVSIISNLANNIIDINNVTIGIARLNSGEYIISITELGNPLVSANLSDVIFKSVTNNGENQILNPLNISQFISLEQSSSIVNIPQAEEFLDTNIFELLPSGDTRQARIVRFFQELNALLPPQPEFDLDNDNYVDRVSGSNAWTGSIDYNKNFSISYAQDNQDGNIDEQDAFIHRLKGTANDTNSTRTIEDIYNTVLPYLTDILEDVEELQDDRPTYFNQSSGYLKFRNPNQGIIIRNTNQDFIEGLDPSNPTYLDTGFTITMWVRFLDKVSTGTLFNFGNPTREENPFGFRLETFVINKEDKISNSDRTVIQTFDEYIDSNSPYHKQELGLFQNSNTERFVRLQVREGGNYSTENDGGLRDSALGMGNIPKSKFNPPDLDKEQDYYFSTADEGAILNYTNIPENFNEWYFICATYNPDIDEPGSDFNVTNADYWLNHVIMTQGGATEDGFSSIDYVDKSNKGNRCKVEIISRTDLLRARGFKV
jgi:hypothetical protein